MATLTPVDYNPFSKGGPELVPVDYNPFEGERQTQAKPANSTMDEVATTAKAGFAEAMKAYSDVAQTFGLNDLANAITGNDVDATKYWATQIAQNQPETEAGKIGAGVLGLLGEAPLFVPGGAAGQVVGLGLAKVAPKTIEKIMPVLEATGSFGGEAALRGKSAEDIGKQALEGAAVGAAGKIAGTVLKNTARPVKAAGTLGLETGALAGSTSVLHNQPITGQSLGETMATLAALKLSHHALRKTHETVSKITATSDDVNAAAEATKARDKRLAELDNAMTEHANMLVKMVDEFKARGEKVDPEVEAEYQKAKETLRTAEEKNAQATPEEAKPTEAALPTETTPTTSEPIKAAPESNGEAPAYALTKKGNVRAFGKRESAQKAAGKLYEATDHPEREGVFALKKRSQNKPRYAASDNFIQRIKELGGITTREMADITGERKANKSGTVGLFRHKGKNIDFLIENMGEDYRIDTSTVDGGVQQFRDMAQAALNGKEVRNVYKEAETSPEMEVLRGEARKYGVDISRMNQEEAGKAVYEGDRQA